MSDLTTMLRPTGRYLLERVLHHLYFNHPESISQIEALTTVTKLLNQLNQKRVNRYSESYKVK